jgi:excisionase family DNA binding protein
MPDSDDLLDIKEAAEYLNVSESSLRRWTNSGRLRCMRIGLRRERRFRRADLLAQLALDSAPTKGRRAAETTRASDKTIDRRTAPRDTHFGGFFASDEGRVRLASTFLEDGLRLGSSCFLVATPEIREEIVSEMASTRPRIQADIDNGRLTLTEHAETGAALLNYFERHLLSATKAGARDFRVAGIMHSFQRRIGHAALVEFEADYDRRIQHRFPIDSLCLYDVRLFTGVECLHALNGHRDSLRFPADRWMA